MKNAGLFVILFFRRKKFEKSTCFLLAGLTKGCDCMKFTFATLITVLIVFAFWGALIYGLIKMMHNKKSSSANPRENTNTDKTIWKNIANTILGVGVVLTLLGAMYIAIVQQGYAIAACFVVASALMGSLWVSSTKKK